MCGVVIRMFLDFRCKNRGYSGDNQTDFIYLCIDKNQ
jgi:hypothetical protein